MAKLARNWEEQRLRALHALRILDTPPEPEFDEITRLAALTLGTRGAAVCLVDKERRWLKARLGTDVSETHSEKSLCNHVVSSGRFLEVLDTTNDARFADGSFVLMGEAVLYYAGTPLVTASGHRLGTLCVFETASRPPMSAIQRRTLQDLAAITAERIESRRMRLESNIAAKVIDTTSDAVLAVGQGGLITTWNSAAQRMFGYSASTAIGNTLDLILPSGASAAAHHLGFARSVAGGGAKLIGKIVELSAKRASGEEFPIELSLARWSATQQGKDGFAAIIRDISPRKALEHDRDDARLFLDNLIHHLPAVLMVKDSKTRKYVLINKAGEELIGRPASEILGSTATDLFENGDEYYDRDTSVLASTDMDSYESEYRRQDGRVFTLMTKRIVIDQPEPGRKYILSLTDDVTDLRRSQDRVLRLAHQDSLTGLSSRSAYIDKVASLLAERRPFAMLAIDLHRFKAVNDQFGHLTGDQLLIEVGNRLRNVTGEHDMVARIGGDEFVVLAVFDDQPIDLVTTVAAAIIAALGEPYPIGRLVAHTGARIGIALAPLNGDSVEELRKAADLALLRAKSEGRGGICFFDPQMNHAAADRRLLERDLRLAVQQREIYVEYQPVITIATGHVSSFEALARWRHPERGAIGPGIFVAIAEESGLIAALGAHVLEIACFAAAKWPAHLGVAVNLSPLQFESHDLVGTISDVLARSGLAADRLQLEITEGVVIRDVDNCFRILAELRALGVQIHMDDFGVGYSSLSYFERFPFDKVKIDRSFVDKMGTVPAARAIIEAVVGLGRTLGMGVVAEGVETEAQRDALIAIGCTHFQGYLFGRPQGFHAFAEVVEKGMLIA